MQKYNREPSNEEIAEILNTTPEKIEDAIMVSVEPTSYDIPVKEDEDTSFRDFIPDRAESTESIVFNSSLGDDINKILESLNPREQEVIKLRYGLGGKNPMTLEDVGKKFGVTRERVRQIEGKALRKLKHPSRGKRIKLKSFKIILLSVATSKLLILSIIIPHFTYNYIIFLKNKVNKKHKLNIYALI